MMMFEILEPKMVPVTNTELMFLVTQALHENMFNDSGIVISHAEVLEQLARKIRDACAEREKEKERKR